MHPQPPSRDHLQAALIAFIEVYGRRHLELNQQFRNQEISRKEMSSASRRLTAIKAIIEAQWLGIPFTLPDEYHFDMQQLSDLIQAEIVGCQQVTATAIETIPGQEELIGALVLIDSLLTSPSLNDDNEPWFFGELPPIWPDHQKRS